MSEKKELNGEQLEKVTGGDNGGQPTFSNKVDDLNTCINEELYFVNTWENGAYIFWFKGILLSVEYEEKYGAQVEMVWIRITDGNDGYTNGMELRIDTTHLTIYKTKN